MKIKGISFSKYQVNLNIYELEKLDLFEFLFTQIILNPQLQDLKLIDCLSNLDIKEDLYYLFNNVYYKFIDNKLLDTDEKDFFKVCIKEIKIKERFVSSIKLGYFPRLKEEMNKDFIYDYLKNKVVLEDKVYNDSNVCLISIDNSVNNLENIINENIKGLLNIENGLVKINQVLIDPYYFDIELIKKENLYISKNNKEIVYKALKDNSLFIEDKYLEGEYLSNNSYYKCLYGKEVLKDYCDYLFVYNKDKSFKTDNNIIYVDYKIDECDFIDLDKKEVYQCGYVILENDDKISTCVKTKSDRISDFKLYLIKNKNKFTINIEEIIKNF